MSTSESRWRRSSTEREPRHLDAVSGQADLGGAHPAGFDRTPIRDATAACTIALDKSYSPAGRNPPSALSIAYRRSAGMCDEADGVRSLASVA
jgi:hypothetical protein